MSQKIFRGILAAVAIVTFGSVARADETRTAGPGERAGKKVDDAADQTADGAKKTGRKVKRKTKKAVRDTGAAVQRAGEKIEDRVGNNQLYSYTDFGNGEVLLSTINYTGSGSTTGDRQVTFAYEGRAAASAGAQDMSSSYLAGGLSMQTKALQSITTAVGATTVRTYTPHYVLAAYSQRLLMASMKECAGTTCHPASSKATVQTSHSNKPRIPNSTIRVPKPFSTPIVGLFVFRSLLMYCTPSDAVPIP